MTSRPYQTEDFIRSVRGVFSSTVNSAAPARITRQGLSQSQGSPFSSAPIFPTASQSEPVIEDPYSLPLSGADFAWFFSSDFVTTGAGGIVSVSDSLDPSNSDRHLIQSSEGARPSFDDSTYARPVAVPDGINDWLYCTSHPNVRLLNTAWTIYVGSYGVNGGTSVSFYRPGATAEYFRLGGDANAGAMRFGSSATSLSPAPAAYSGAIRQTWQRDLGTGLTYSNSQGDAISATPDRGPFGLSTGLAIFAWPDTAAQQFSGDPMACVIGFPAAHDSEQQSTMNAYVEAYLEGS